jgi:hypothetical protein
MCPKSKHINRPKEDAELDEIPRHFFSRFVPEREVPVKTRACDQPGCSARGDYRAPKSRKQIEEHYWFCLDHVKEYNAAWDYYRGMTPLEIERAIRFGAVWERPSWPLGKSVKEAEDRARKAFEEMFKPEGDQTGQKQAEEVHARAYAKGVDPRYKGEIEALRELGLLPPVDFATIKARYRNLVKHHHPDVKGGDKDAEEKIKRLNSAFTLLKAFYAEEEI